MYSGEVITSNNNPLVKRLAKLNDPKYRRIEGLFLCEGKKLAEESIKYADVKYLLVSADKVDEYGELIQCARQKNVDVVLLADSPFSKISTEKAPQGIISVVLTDPSPNEGISCMTGHIFLADGIRDPGNLGTIIRTAGAMGFDSLVLSDCADIYNPKTVRASMGGIFRLGISVTDDMLSVISELKESGRRIFATALTDKSVSLGSFELSENDVFIVGNEGHGLSDELISVCSETVMIDMSRDTESLNVSVAASILMWELSKTFRPDATGKEF